MMIIELPYVTVIFLITVATVITYRRDKKKRPYVLTKRTYDTMIGRGYNLTCKICGEALEIGDLVESKPSKYRHWECFNCKEQFNFKPQKNLHIGEYWYYRCPQCGGVAYCIGRKFYHSSCYEGSHYDINGANHND